MQTLPATMVPRRGSAGPHTKDPVFSMHQRSSSGIEHSMRHHSCRASSRLWRGPTFGNTSSGTEALLTHQSCQQFPSAIGFVATASNGRMDATVSSAVAEQGAIGRCCFRDPCGADSRVALFDLENFTMGSAAGKTNAEFPSLGMHADECDVSQLQNLCTLPLLSTPRINLGIAELEVITVALRRCGPHMAAKPKPRAMNGPLLSSSSSRPSSSHWGWPLLCFVLSLCHLRDLEVVRAQSTNIRVAAHDTTIL